MVLHGSNVHFSDENRSENSRHAYIVHFVEGADGFTWAADNWWDVLKLASTVLQPAKQHFFGVLVSSELLHGKSNQDLAWTCCLLCKLRCYGCVYDACSLHSRCRCYLSCTGFSESLSFHFSHSMKPPKHDPAAAESLPSRGWQQCLDGDWNISALIFWAGVGLAAEVEEQYIYDSCTLARVHAE